MMTATKFLDKPMSFKKIFVAVKSICNTNTWLLDVNFNLLYYNCSLKEANSESRKTCKFID